MATKSNVNLIDPNEVIGILPVEDNGIGSYEDLTIFAELKAIRKSRSILIDDGVALKTQSSFNNDSVKINLMGFDQSEENNYQHTTKWSENYNINPTETKYEGFGITNIKVLINSSYVPTVTIDFEDVRGLVLFNEGKDSPYSILFDFPPPIFELTLKGFYGKAIKYDLHLTKIDTNFNGDKSTFTVSAKFIVRTFAPLSDVLFKYSLISSLMELDERGEVSSISSDPTGVPKNTYEYIKKLETLYEGINDLAKAGDINKKLEENRTLLERLQEIRGSVNKFWLHANDSSRDESNSKIIIYSSVVGTVVEPSDTYEIIGNTGKFEALINNEGTSNVNLVTNNKIYIGFKNSDDNSFNERLLESIREKLNILSFGIIEYTIPENFITIGGGLNSKLPEKYFVLDITDFYIRILKELNSVSDRIKKSNEDFTDEVNSIARKELGDEGYPTIGNVFRFLCNDVDSFYNKLRDVGIRAERHHNEYFNTISSDSSIKEKNKQKIVTAFPLYVVEENIIDINQCATKRQEKRIPEKLSNNLSEPFPEVEFVNEFISKFVDYTAIDNISNLKKQTDDQGNNKWIPLNPMDSKLNELNGLNYESPYILDNTKNNPSDIIDRMLERFYVFTQYSYSNAFDGEIERNILEFGGKSDAANLINSLDDSELIGLTSQSINKTSNLFKTDVDEFYKFLKREEENGNINNYSSLPSGDTTKKYTTLGGTDQKFFRDPSNDGYNRGFTSVSRNDIEVKVENGNTIVDEFQESLAPSLFQKFVKFIGLTTNNLVVDEFSKENIPLFLDSEDEYDSKFTTNLLDNESILDKWVDVLSLHSTYLIDVLGDKTEENVFFLLSSFGIANGIQKDKYRQYFLIPSILEVPNFLIPYMGGYIKYHTDNVFKESYNELFIDNTVLFEDNIIITEIEDDSEENINKVLNLSKNDRDFFLDAFDETFNSEDYEVFLVNLLVLLTTIRDNSLSEGEIRDELKNNELLLGYLIGKPNNNYLLSNSDSLLSGKANYPDYQTLDEIIDNDKKEYADIYFESFFTYFSENIKNRRDEITEEKERIKSRVNDSDIKTELYYSFKNIYDKWIAGEGSVARGFPTNQNGSTLFDSFVFVDRAFNDIGGVNSVVGDKTQRGCVISVDQLVDASKDFNINMFTLMSQILSVNNFEFFPLSTFLSFKEGDWEDSFRTFTSLEQTAQQSFVCMYIGGTSSVLDNGNDEFGEDGIVSLTEDLPSDFSNGCIDSTPQPLNPNYGDGKYGQVRAFRIRFGSQAQSVFTDIKFASREYTETNESLQILSRIAQDESKSTPVPKGQNLFSVYENRAYSSTVTMMGNMMIQPTQYFQIENIPLFNGAYIITKVTHDFSPNTAKTSFEGTKIVRYPVPFVYDFATSMRLKGSTILSAGEGLSNGGTITINPDKNGNTDLGNIGGAVFVGMNELKIIR